MSEAGPQGEQANTGLSLCPRPWRYAQKKKKSGERRRVKMGQIVPFFRWNLHFVGGLSESKRSGAG